MPDEDQIQVSQEYIERLFASIYGDLNLRNQNKNLYNSLNAARLIRQLIIDGDRLIDQVNRHLRLPIQFIVPKIGPAASNLRGIADIYPKELQPNLDDLPPGYYLHPMKISEYTSHSFMNFGDNEISVADVIKFVANHYGGVHLPPFPSDEKAILMHKFNNMIRVGNEQVVINCLHQIEVQVLRGLNPVYLTIMNKYSGNG